jgi:hypothetical protein
MAVNVLAMGCLICKQTVFLFALKFHMVACRDIDDKHHNSLFAEHSEDLGLSLTRSLIVVGCSKRFAMSPSEMLFAMPSPSLSTASAAKKSDPLTCHIGLVQALHHLHDIPFLQRCL